MTRNKQTFETKTLSNLIRHGGAATLMATASFTGQYAAAAPVSAIYVFGDSSADVGSTGIRPSNLGLMWPEVLAAGIGKADRPARNVTLGPTAITGSTPAGGTNYAINGAVISPNLQNWTVNEELDAFAADHHAFAKSDLTFVWATRNDISESFFINQDFDKGAFAASYDALLTRMHGLGARNIVAFNDEQTLLPLQALRDGGFPDPLIAQFQGAIGQENAALKPVFKKADVFVIDVNRLGDYIIAHPTLFGFTHTTDSYIGRGDPVALAKEQAQPNDGNVFEGSGHYSTAAHHVVADYVAAELRARDQFLGVLEQEKSINQDRSRSLDADFAADFERSAVSSGAWSLAAFGDAAGVHRSSTGGFDTASNGNTRWGGFRVDRRFGDVAALGLGLGLGAETAKFAGATGAYNSTSTGVQVMGLYRLASRLTLQGSFTSDFFNLHDFNRLAVLSSYGNHSDVETAHGSTKGQYYAANVDLKYHETLYGWRSELGLGLQWQKSRTNAFQDAKSLLALAYGDSAISDLNLRVGVSASKLTPIFGVTPFGSIQYSRDLRGQDYRVAVGPSADLVVNDFAPRPYRDQLYLTVGGEAAVARNVTVRLAYSIGGSTDRFRDRIAGVKLSLEKRF